MAAPGTKPATIACVLIIIFGIIHFGSGIGIVARYRKYQDVFRPSVGIGAFDILVGLYAIGVGALCLVAVMQQRPALTKIGAICTFVLGVLSMASLITALVINSQAVGYIRSRLTYRVNTYIETQSSISVIDLIQTHYQCCGVNLWLDWQTVGLGLSTNVGTNTGTNTGTGVVTNTDSNTGTVSVGRRRRSLDLLISPLVGAIRKRRQTVTTGNNIYGLPSSYSFNLPLSCCINGGVGSGNAIGGYCNFAAGNGTNGFYIQGCIVAVANTMVIQITGLVILNVCLFILAIVLIPILIFMFPAAFDPTNPNNKQSLSDQRGQEQQQQQYPNGGNYGNYYDPNSAPQTVYYSYPEQTYVTYQ